MKTLCTIMLTKITGTNHLVNKFISKAIQYRPTKIRLTRK